ncbi:hypothetical protein CEXT_22201 [Caerostris extrusa]|uniref:Uncharacterized protein n=1 Tax=Caerostris extrusa TaxID=172846 RepID=A0AAV4XSK8_CAEEX|nr:hypothetical protein CEXT_22201 [Caerostris extrusa]
MVTISSHASRPPSSKPLGQRSPNKRTRLPLPHPTTLQSLPLPEGKLGNDPLTDSAGKHGECASSLLQDQRYLFVRPKRIGIS